MTTSINTQALVTEETAQLFDININGYNIQLANGHNFAGGFTTIGNYQYIEIQMSGVRSDLTGAMAEPSLQIACAELWKNSTWETATFGFTSLSEYQGQRVRRRRIFYDDPNGLFFEQNYYIKEVSNFDAYSIEFTLTPTKGGDTLDLPSARKLDLKDC